ncbi:MAG: PEP-CTERM sorting domain-containing protein, partial [Kiritimatiellae bacterium]|nr:PEP-CTERM sorting domain-containing protein [Kiritimatiellia bacterium]
YVAEGAPTYSGGLLQNGTVVGTASGYAIDGTTLYAQMSEDTTTRLAGNYYVVLFNDSSQYAVSTSALAYDNDTAITSDFMTPAEGAFSPDTFSGWAPVPEPATAMLLLFGGVMAALRRRKTA